MTRALILFLILLSADNGIRLPIFLEVDGKNVAIVSGSVILETDETRIVLDVLNKMVSIPKLEDLNNEVRLSAIINDIQFDFGMINSKLIMFDQETALKFRIDNYPFENEFEFGDVNWDSLSSVQYLILDPKEYGDGIELIEFVLR